MYTWAQPAQTSVLRVSDLLGLPSPPRRRALQHHRQQREHRADRHRWRVLCWERLGTRKVVVESAMVIGPLRVQLARIVRAYSDIFSIGYISKFHWKVWHHQFVVHRSRTHQGQQGGLGNAGENHGRRSDSELWVSIFPKHEKRRSYKESFPTTW